MAGKRGFTLLELMVVLVILGIMATIVVSSLFVSVERTRAQQAKNNLLAISAAQQKYFEDYGYYCINQSPNPNCGNSQNLHGSLSLDMTASDPFIYNCSAASGGLYQCTASDGTVTLILNVTAANGAIVTCTASNSGYCPS